MTFATTEHATLENLTNRLIEEYKNAPDVQARERINLKVLSVAREFPEQYANILFKNYFAQTKRYN